MTNYFIKHTTSTENFGSKEEEFNKSASRDDLTITRVPNHSHHDRSNRGDLIMGGLNILNMNSKDNIETVGNFSRS